MAANTGRLRYASLLTLLIASALLLSAHLVYLFLADAKRFPITRVQVAASYQHITRPQLESVVMSYLNASFFSIPIHRLEADLLNLSWSAKVSIERVWPDTLKITLLEKTPIAIWNGSYMTAEGELVDGGKEENSFNLPQLSGPNNQQKDVLHIYQKMSKLLAMYGLAAASLQLRDNQAWELFLTNGTRLRLGKRDLETRLQRFCKAYPAIIASKQAQLASVDLRYARGMAVQWKQPMRK